MANKIQELINSDYIVYDKKKGYRKITYKDIVILLRTTSNTAPIYEKELSELNIPVFSDSSSKSLEQVEIQTIMSVLKIINNPLQDIPLITVLRSSIANFTDNDLVQIRLADKSESFYNAMLKARVSVESTLRQKITNFINMLEKWKNMEEYNTLDELIWQIYEESNYYNYVGLLSNGKLRQANLKMLFEKARQYEQASFKGLYNFINFIDKIKTSNKDMGSAKIIGENENVVRIMSIHKSKGLEFPVVFLSGTSKKFNQRDLNDNILMHQDLGFGPKYINYERKIEYNTLAKEALKIKLKTESLSEEMRILYVALTRAKEKLYITGIEKDFGKSIKEKEELIQIYNGDKLNRNLIKKYKSYLDWIELVNLNCKEEIKDLLQIYEHSYKEFISNEKKEEEQIDLVELLKSEAGSQMSEVGSLKYTHIMNNEELQENAGNIINHQHFEEAIKDTTTMKIEEILNWKYKYKSSENIPTKTSVSKIKEEKGKQKALAQFGAQNEEQKHIEQTLSAPKFTKEETITSAQKGTLVHLCIKNLNETKQYNYEDIQKLIQSLQNKKIITKKEAEAININQILQYTKSNLFKELKCAKEVHKEEPFYINIKAKEIYEQEIEENILVQGIIDLYYIDKEGNLNLVDYKTDYVQNENELILKYKEQLDLYKRALEEALKIKVSKVVIYSTYLKKEIEL